MAHDSAEGFHPVPSVRRARTANPMSGDKKDSKPDLTAEHGPVVRTEVEKHPDGSAHVTAHHEKGHVEVSQHANEADAHDHAKNIMSGGDPMNSDGKIGDNDDSEGECPECGGPMKDGKCQQCGYEDKGAAAMGGGGGDDSDQMY